MRDGGKTHAYTTESDVVLMCASDDVERRVETEKPALLNKVVHYRNIK